MVSKRSSINILSRHAIIFLASSVITFLITMTMFIGIARADDGGWAECGGTLDGWFGCEGSGATVALSTVTSLWVGVGVTTAMAVNSVGSLIPQIQTEFDDYLSTIENENVDTGVTVQETQEPEAKAQIDLWDIEPDKGESFAQRLGMKYTLLEGVYTERKIDTGFDIFGGGLGAEVGKGMQGENAELYGEAYQVKGDIDGVLGGEQLGLLSGVGTSLVTGDAFAGVPHNTIGASIGGILWTVDGKIGANIAGLNINLIGEVGLKAELGISSGAKTETQAPFIFTGLSFGKIGAS